ncbi:e3 ubiquitin-protein ligase RNF13 [Trichonephila clavipes]|uniref:E3 ubiquitin-protein ligase RNF13 n=1 Tax=Trichonephila clavipes TaxID=2585209 RepID=A0A8X6VQE4_TRICX|nr:e3 ubiquitin-protein ligase RNF13 [Trichonephila clavipes]
MTPHTIIPAVGAVYRCKAKAGLRCLLTGLHTRTRLSSLLKLSLDSSLRSTWFYSAAVQFPCERHHSKRRRRWVGVKGIMRNGCRHKIHGSLVKVLPVPGWQPVKQLAVRVHFL